MPRSPADVPAAAVAAVLAWSARGGEPCTEGDVRSALAPLSADEQRHVLALLGRTEIPDLSALIDAARGAPPPRAEVSAPTAGRKRRRLDLPAIPEDRRRALRELDQRAILDLYARHRDDAGVAAALGIDAAALQRTLHRLGLQRRVRALLRGELVRYPPLRPHGVPARPATPIRRRAPEKPPEPAPPAPDPDRARVLALFERARGLRRRVAEWLGITPEELEQRSDALSIRPEVNRIRARARRAALKDAPLADRLRQVLTRAPDLEDLGILWKVDREVRAEVERVWREVCAQCPSGRAAQVALADALALSADQVRRLVARYQLTFEK